MVVAVRDCVKVLVAEDEHSISKLLEVILCKRGFEVICAHDGIEALEKMRQVSPHIVILDLNMPRMDGFKVLETMGRDVKLSHIPVIISSASGGEEQLSKARSLGAVGWLSKIYLADAAGVVERVIAAVERGESDLWVDRRTSGPV